MDALEDALELDSLLMRVYEGDVSDHVALSTLIAENSDRFGHLIAADLLEEELQYQVNVANSRIRERRESQSAQVK